MSELQSKPELLGMFPDEIRDYMLSLGEPKYRAGQIFPALHKGLRPSAMTNISKATAEKIENAMPCRMPEIEQKLVWVRSKRRWIDIEQNLH